MPQILKELLYISMVCAARGNLPVTSDLTGLEPLPFGENNTKIILKIVLNQAESVRNDKI